MSESSGSKTQSIVSSIYKRIEHALPVRSQVNISTYRSDPFYMETKKALINFGDTIYLNDICTHTYDLLINLNEMESAEKMTLVPLKDRTTNNLRSNYLLLRLLSDILQSNWQKAEGNGKTNNVKESSVFNNNRTLNSKITHNSLISDTNESINFKTVRPRPIPTPIVSKLLSFLAKLKTNHDILETLEQITNHLYQNPNNKASEDKDKDNQELIALVDATIDSVVRYIAAANPKEFYEYLNTRLRNVNLDYHIITRCDFLSLAYIDSSNVISFFNLIKDILVNIKRVSQQNLLIAFLDKALENWIISRPLDYIKATKSLDIAITTDSLFEIVYKNADWKVYYKAVYSFLASLLLLIPVQFQKYVQYNAEKHSSKLSNLSLKRFSAKYTNKQKVIQELVNIVHKHPTAGTSITKVLFTAAILSFLKTTVKHEDLANDTESDYLSIIMFSKQMCKPLCRHLSLDHPDYYPLDTDSRTFDILRYAFFASFIILEPELVDTAIPDLIRSQKETSRHIIYIFNGLELLTNTPLFYENGETRFHRINSLVLPKLGRFSKELVHCDPRLHRLDENAKHDTDSVDSEKSSESLMDMMDVLQQRDINNGGTNTLSISSSSVGTTPISDDYTLTPTATSRPSLANQLPQSSSSNSSASNHHHSSSIKNFYKPTKHMASRVFQSVSSSSSSSGSGSSSSQLGKEGGSGISSSADVSESNASKSTLQLDNDLSKSSILTTRPTTPLSLASPLSGQPSEAATINSSDFVKPSYFILSYEHPPSEYVKLPLLQNEIVANVVKCLLRIYIRFPSFVLEIFDSTEEDAPLYAQYEASLTKILEPIAPLLLSSDEQVRTTTDTFLLNLCSTIDATDGHKMAISYFATAIAIDAIAKLSLNPTVSTKEQTSLMEFLSRFLDLREYVIASDSKELYLSGRDFHKTGGCSRLVSNLEKSIYLGLFSSNLELYHISRRSLGHYMFILNSKHHLPTCFQHYSLELCKSIVGEKSPVGEAAIRKKLRDHLCKLKGPTESLIEIWEIMFERFCSVHGIDPHNLSTNTSDTQNDVNHAMSIYDDYGEYIASLGGIIVSPEMAYHPKRERLEEYLTFFFTYKMENLFTNNHKRVDAIREVLCVSMHPNCAGIILKLLHTHVETFVQCLKEKLFNVCEMMILVTRTTTQLDHESLFGHSVLLIDLNIHLLAALKEYENDAEFTYDPAYQRMRLKLIKLQTLLASRMEELALYGMVLKKNQYASLVVEYLENSFKFMTPSVESKTTKLLDFGSGDSVPTIAASSGSGKTTTSSNATVTNEPGSKTSAVAHALGSTGGSESKKRSVSMASSSGFIKTPELIELQYDVAFEASSTLKYVFHDLPVDSYKNLGLARDSDDIISIFTHYFNLFVRILEYLNLNKDNSNTNLNMSIKHRSTSIIKNVIDILVNLLQSNVDLGVRNAIPLGFHEDQLLRVSFINVFSKIIADVQSKGKMLNSEDFAVLQYKSMEILSNETDLYLAVVQCANLSEVDELATAFMTISNDKKKILEIMTNLIKYDILNTTDSVEILRSNTVATRMLAIFSQNEGSEYVAKILTPFLEELDRTNESFEVERIKTDDPNAEQNFKLFWKYLELLTDTLCNSIPYMPYGLRVVANMVYEATSVNFPESKIAALGAFFFLRIINPAIISPERVGIETTKDSQRSRSLIQIARVLQLMANETVNTLKWPLLVDHIDDLRKMKSRVNQFMHEASAQVTKEEEEQYGNNLSSNEVDNEKKYADIVLKPSSKKNIADFASSYKFFHAFFYDHYTELCDVYLNPANKSTESIQHKIKVIRRINNFQKITGVPQRVTSYQIPEGVRNNKSEKGILLYDFMSQYSLRTGVEKSDFIKVQTTRDGFPMIIIVYRDIPEGCSIDMVCYSLLQVLTKYWDSQYCLMIDCTLFSSSFNPAALMESLVSMIDDKYLQNCIRYYNFNMSHEYYNGVQLNIMKSQLVGILVNADVIFLNSTDDAKTFNKHGMNVYKNEATEDSRVVFNDVAIYQPESKRLVSARLIIGNDYLQVVENQLVRVKLNNKKVKSIKLVDVYSISELRNIRTSNYSGVSNEISIFDDRTNKNLTLISKKKVSILRTLYFSKSRYSRESQELEAMRKSREKEESKDILRNSLGYILHMSFTGLLSVHDDVRSASLTLLSSVVKTYKLDAGRKVESVSDLPIPSEDINFITRVSQSICENHPLLTFNFLTAFFDTYDSLKSVNAKTSLVIYTAPWLTQIYQHVLLADPRYGLKRTTELIHKFVKLTKDRSVFVVALSKLIWSPLCLEDNIGDIVIDEIVAACIDHEAEGNEWNEMAVLWPVSSSIKLCDLSIRRLHDRSHMMLSDSMSDFELHTRWIEISVLVKFLSYMIFNVDLFVNLYLGELLYIISVFMDVGPMELRVSVLKLTIRTFHSFLTKSELSSKQVTAIKEKLESLNGARYRMLFGLTRVGDEASNFFEVPKSGEIMNRIHSVEAVSEVLFALVEDCGSAITNDKWIVNWTSNILKLVFRDDAFLQTRAIIIYGSLCKSGINNTVLHRFLKLMTHTMTSFATADKYLPFQTSLFVCELHCLKQMMSQLPKHSHFVGKFFWLSTSLSLVDNFTVYQFAIQMLAQAMQNIDLETERSGIPGLDFIFSQRAIFGKDLETFESYYHFKFTRETFDILLLHLCSKGLLVPFSYINAFNSLKTIFRIRLKWEKKAAAKENRPIDLNVFCYIVVIYKLFSTDEEAYEVLEECGMTDFEIVKISDKFHCPRELVDFLVSDTFQTHCAVVISSEFLNHKKNSDNLILRNIELYRHIFYTDSTICWRVFPYISPCLERYTESSKSLSVLRLVLPLMQDVVLDERYSQKDELSKILDVSMMENQVEGIKNSSFTNNNPFDYPTEENLPVERRTRDAIFMKKALFRIMSTHIEDE